MLSWLSWWGLHGGLDVGVYRAGPATFTVGLAGSYNKPVLLEGLASWLASGLDPEGTWDFDMVDRAWSARLGASFRHEHLFQPYAVFGVGRDTMRMAFSYDGTAGSGSGSLGQTGLMLTPGAGFELVTESGFALDVELTYRVFRTSVTSQQLEVSTAGGQPLIAVDKEAWQIPPRGFSWVVAAGWRF